MSDLSYKLMTLRPALRPIAESAAWSATFIIASIINQETAYFLILLLVLAIDVLDFTDKRKSLLRDLAAGAMITFLALLLNDRLGLYVGATIAIVAVARVSISLPNNWIQR
jgi:hypothetical protein